MAKKEIVSKAEAVRRLDKGQSAELIKAAAKKEFGVNLKDHDVYNTRTAGKASKKKKAKKTAKRKTAKRKTAKRKTAKRKTVKRKTSKKRSYRRRTLKGVTVSVDSLSQAKDFIQASDDASNAKARLESANSLIEQAGGVKEATGLIDVVADLQAS